ncbi:MAG TPA: hypothetical protein VGA42_10375 [Gemmatimonadales bacterium]
MSALALWLAIASAGAAPVFRAIRTQPERYDTTQTQAVSCRSCAAGSRSLEAH